MLHTRSAIAPSRGTVICLLAAVQAACALGSRLTFREPSIRLASVQVLGIGFTGGSLNIQLEVENPNSYELRTTRFMAGLELEDTHFGEAVLDQRVVMPAETVTLVDVPVTFTWEGVGAGARALFERGTVNYSLASRITLDTPVGERTVDLRNGGVVPLRDLIR